MNTDLKIGEHIYRWNWAVTKSQYGVLLGMAWHTNTNSGIDYQLQQGSVSNKIPPNCFVGYRQVISHSSQDILCAEENEPKIFQISYGVQNYSQNRCNEPYGIFPGNSLDKNKRMPFDPNSETFQYLEVICRLPFLWNVRLIKGLRSRRTQNLYIN